MPLSDRNYMRREHPSACTCADCVNKRLKRLGINPRKRTSSHKKQKSAQKAQLTNEHPQTKSQPQPEYHPPTLRLSTTDKQTRIKRDYPRHVRIIANIILFLIVIFAIGLLGGGIYGIAKYHDDALRWVSQQYHKLADDVITLVDIPELINTPLDIAADSEMAITITKNKIASFIDKINNTASAIKEKISNGEILESAKPSLDDMQNLTPTPPAQEHSQPPNSIPPTIPTTKQVATNIREAEELAFLLINAYREDNGIPSTVWDDNLYKLSKAHTEEMARSGELFHGSGDEVGENAWGGKGYSRYSNDDLAIVIVKGWVTSPLHNAWLLHAPIKESVVSIVVTPNGQYASWSFWMNRLNSGPELVTKISKEWKNSGSNLDWISWLKSKGYID